MTKLRVLDLFSGIGGFSLGLERTGGFETVAFCEIEEFPRRVLRKHWPEVPQFEDVRKLRGEDVGAIDVICGGYPCQPFSTAGKRRGQKDDRHLWPEFSRLVAELRPSWVIGENVAGHISMGLDDVLSDLEGQGYACRPFVIPACALGAHHRRDRTWVIAHSNNVLHEGELDVGANCGAASGGQGEDKFKGASSYRERVRTEPGAGREDVADSKGDGRALCGAGDKRRNPDKESEQLISAEPGRESPRRGAGAVANAKRQRCGQMVSSVTSGQKGKEAASSAQYSGFPRGWEGWLAEPRVGRVADGVPRRVDRLKALGNAVVPQIPEMIGYAILEAA